MAPWILRLRSGFRLRANARKTPQLSNARPRRGAVFLDPATSLVGLGSVARRILFAKARGTELSGSVSSFSFLVSRKIKNAFKEHEIDVSQLKALGADRYH